MSSLGQKEDKNRPWKDLSEVPRLRQSPRFRSRPENKEFPQGSNLSKEAIGKFNPPKGQFIQKLIRAGFGGQNSSGLNFEFSPIAGAQEIPRAKI